MKKSHILLFVLSAGLLLGGCNNATQAKDTLNAQLQQVESIVGSTNIEELAQVSPLTTFDANTAPSTIQNYKATSYQNMQKEEIIRQDILSINSCIKNCTKKPFKLSNSDANAIKQLSNNINRYTSTLAKTKPHVKDSIKKIKKHLNSNNTLNLTEAESSYISLNNLMNERYAYMSNIYSNLEEIYHLVGCGEYCTDCNESSCNATKNREISEEDGASNQMGTSSHYKADNHDTTTGRKSNIDTYVRATTPNPNDVKQIPLEQPQAPLINNGTIPPVYANQPYYNNGFNPNRNTDSFYPKMRNIDTYRYPPNTAYYGYNSALPNVATPPIV